MLAAPVWKETEQVRYPLIAIVGMLSVLIVACGGGDDQDTPAAADATGPQAVTIQAEDIRFEPMEIRVKAGTSIELTLVNTGALEHDFTAPGLNATDDIVEPHGHGDGEQSGGHMMGDMEPGTVHLAAAGGEEAHVEFTARPGTISFYCSVPGHKEAGMTGTIVVE